MHLTKNSIYYLAVAGLFLGLKSIYTFSGNNELLFLLKPTSGLIELITNSTGTYTSNHGFYHHTLHIVIDKSCSGFNFLIILFSMSLVMVLKFSHSILTKLVAFPGALIFAYILTVLVNTSRIVVSLVTPLTISQKYAWLHQAEGAFIYISFLVSIYLALDYTFKRLLLTHAKLA